MTFGPGSTYGDGGTGATTAYMALTWIGIVVMVIVFVGWVWYENHRADHVRQDRQRARRTTSRPPRRARATRRSMNGMSKQIEFPPLQNHAKGFEHAMIAISIICAIVVLVIVLFTNIGNEFRPTV